MGYRGSERSTRRAVAEVKVAWRAGRRRRYRPWIPEPGMWLQWDWGDGPGIRGAEDPAVLGVAGLVPVPRGDPGLGPAAGHPDLVHRTRRSATAEHIAACLRRFNDLIWIIYMKSDRADRIGPNASRRFDSAGWISSLGGRPSG